MPLNKVFIAILLLSCRYPVFAQKKITISSPSKALTFTFHTEAGHPLYSVFYKGKELVKNSSIGLTFEGNELFGIDIKTGHTILSHGVDDYVLPEGKTSKVYDTYNEAYIPMQERKGGKRRVALRVRVFNDGVAFRYELADQSVRHDFVLTDENTTFRLTGDPVARIAFLENFTTSHEHRYNLMPISEIPNDTLMDMPALFRFPDHIYMAITEANLLDYAGMSLIKRNGLLSSQLTPWPGQQLIKVKAALPHLTPWRVMMISDRIGALIESNILTDLASPCRIKDTSWLAPGKATFHWWNGDISPDTTWEPGENFDFEKYYIDFCARNHIEYHTIIGYRQVAWYQNDGDQYAPGPHTDVMQPRPGLDIQALSDYAKSEGVRLRFWVHWQALYPKIDSAFALYQKWGIEGMMVDFLDRDDQQMVNIQEEILRKAAAHHLEIEFHGAYKPTGLSRTYPNESTREGTLNYENDKWGNLITPDDDINIPFTRGLAGCTDYHLGGFRAMPEDHFKVLATRPHVLATRCHMLAMYVVLENHLSMVCDYPKAYEGQPGFDFITEVPTVWDQTVVPGAEEGKWVSIARRKGSDWYLGVINNSQPRTVTIPLDFLSKGKYSAEIYRDAPDAVNHPNDLIKETREIDSADSLTIHLPSGGGEVVRIVEK